MTATHLLSPRMLLGLTLGLAVGCGPSQADLDAANDEAASLRSALEETRADNARVGDRVRELEAQNEQIEAALARQGESVQQLEGERETLAARLEETRRALAELREREQQAQARLATFRQLLGRFQSLIEAGQLSVRIRNNRMIVELPEGILFDTARADIKDEGQAALREVAAVLANIDEREFQVSGHTDNVPIRTRRFPSNWELSTQRAVNVAKLLVDAGVSAQRLSAAGYAETQPVAANDSAEGRQQNRRIEIVLLPNLDELPDLSSLSELGSEGGETR
ncbi:MAG: OmpA family protein [Myxococcota bacterium]